MVVTSVLKYLAILAVSTAFLPHPSIAQYRFLENGTPLNRGSDSGFLLDTPTRAKIDLSGVWNFTVENGPSGTVRVPSAYDFVGRVTFERRFEVTVEQLDNFRFHFVMFGANYNCEVSLNGDFITNHSGGYTSFVQPIPENTIQVGAENVVRVVVNNQLDPQTTLPLRSQVWGWRNYGGILRDVFILATPKLFIKDVVVDSDLSRDHSSATLVVNALIEGKEEAASEPAKSSGKGAKLAFYVAIIDKVSGGSVRESRPVPLVWKDNEWETARAELTIKNPKLWSPEAPELYLLKCYIVRIQGKEVNIIDEYDLNQGLRTVEVTSGDIMLNGDRLVLNGVIWHEDHPLWGSAMTYEDLEKDVVLMKKLGANVVRFGNHPPHPYMLNLCDRYGLMAMVELPVVNIPAKVLEQKFYLDLASAMMKEMITRDKDHPSVLAWGIGDGFESSAQSSRVFVESLVRLAKDLDNRPTYFGSRMLGNDLCSDLVDIAAVNVYTNDLRSFTKQLEDWKNKYTNQPVIVSKFGTEVQQDNRNGYSDPLSYEAQARFYIQRFSTIKSLNYDGAILCSFNDWKGDRPALTVSTGDPWMHSMGLVNYQREKRVAYDAVRSIFRGERFVALPSGNYTASAPVIYVLSGLVVLIGVAYFYNANRRFRGNLHRSMMNSYNFFADVRDQRIVSILHSTALGIVVSVATAIVVSSILYHFKNSWVFDNLLSFILVDDSLKESVVHLIWDPLSFIGYFSVIFFVMLLAICTLVFVLSPLFKRRIYPFHSYSVTMWATPPLLVLIPIGMILFRVMESDVYVVPSLIVVAVLLIWVLLRLLKGVSIILDVYVAKVYLVGFFSVTGILALAYFYLEYTQSASIYLSFMYNIVSTSQ
ncbi:MAG: hypothetical protein O7D34_08790 [Ignavibacteria bacterium]|nr:hypothetical protein [Ignavibacteria bacterium]